MNQNQNDRDRSYRMIYLTGRLAVIEQIRRARWRSLAQTIRPAETDKRHRRAGLSK